MDSGGDGEGDGEGVGEGDGDGEGEGVGEGEGDGAGVPSAGKRAMSAQFQNCSGNPPPTVGKGTGQSLSVRNVVLHPETGDSRYPYGRQLFAVT